MLFWVSRSGFQSYLLLYAPTFMTFMKTRQRALIPTLQGLGSLMAAAGAAPLSTVSIFSSTSALLGPAGQANYAAANAALGAWADQQHAAGVAATSVMWGAWAAGMAAVDKVC